MIKIYFKVKTVWQMGRVVAPNINNWWKLIKNKELGNKETEWE